MTKLLLALAILSMGSGGFLTARYSTIRLAREMNANRDAWVLQSQQVAAVQGEQADLAARIRALKASLAQSQPVAENALWSALQTNRADNLAPELRERVLEELGFNWRFSPDFIVVTKETVRGSRSWMLLDSKLSLTAAVLALTPEERKSIAAAMERAQAEFNDWALAHVERREPKRDEVASYFLPSDPAFQQSLSNNIATGVFAAGMGQERTELLRGSINGWMRGDIGFGTFFLGRGELLTITREMAGNEQRLSEFDFPAMFRPIFPNGWADVAKREGFEIPKRPEKQQP
jgi:hypothetical protein